VVLEPQTRGSGWTSRDGPRSATSADAPAPTFTIKATHWKWSLRSNNQANATVRNLDEPAATLFFGHRANECTWQQTNAQGEPTLRINLTTAEAGVLQTFPADYPWRGTKSRQFEQIGNAVPPVLAQHLLRAHVSREDHDLAA
jgi:DNA (cytosine-5)-methyltransferase 1